MVLGPGVSGEVGDAAADRPREDKSSVWCESSGGARLNLEWGVTGAAGADALLAHFSTMGVLSCSAMMTSNIHWLQPPCF